MTINVTETPRLANGAERKVYQRSARAAPAQRPRDSRPARHRPPQGPRGRLRRRHRRRRHRLPRGQGRRGLARRRDAGGRSGGGREHKIEPVRQAREACYALRDFIEKDPAGPRAGCAGTTSSSCPTPRSPTTSRCPSARGGRSSTATTSRTSSTSSSTSSIRQELDRPLLDAGGHRPARQRR